VPKPREPWRAAPGEPFSGARQGRLDKCSSCTLLYASYRWVVTVKRRSLKHRKREASACTRCAAGLRVGGINQ
jgi:hypothetical protein